MWPVKDYQHLPSVGVPPLAIGFGHVSKDDPLLRAILTEHEWQMGGHGLGSGMGEQYTEAVSFYEFVQLKSIGNLVMFGNIHRKSPAAQKSGGLMPSNPAS